MPTDKRERQRAGREARRAEVRAAQKRAQRRRQIISIVALLAVVIGIGLFINLSGGDDEGTDTASSTTTTSEASEQQAVGTSPCPAADGSSEKKAEFDGPPQPCLTDGAAYSAVVETDVGSFTIALDREKAPQTVNNFVFLARYHAYDGVPFHRVIKDFVVQGGDVALQNGTGDAGYKFDDELPAPEDYEEGSVAMANSGPNTNGSQFYIVVSEAGAKTLVEAVGGEAKYSLFGKVTDGMSVVKQIEADGTVAGTPDVVHKIVNVTITEQEG